jgi:hypothetical protein
VMSLPTLAAVASKPTGLNRSIAGDGWRPKQRAVHRRGISVTLTYVT